MLRFSDFIVCGLNARIAYKMACTKEVLQAKVSEHYATSSNVRSRGSQGFATQ
ncbi:hypothetical protein [Helicobacter cynogastricus]|uniref:hypothetical protein n=1 Tax=Helicobacter cynogastricus TaxID=329937 RepID=UPI001315376C|nr:hypothetical protein [Helicobacter cynogastricus]